LSVQSDGRDPRNLPAESIRCEAEITREEHQALALNQGAEVYVSPREMKVFADDDRDATVGH
jgi:hypothetical protein